MTVSSPASKAIRYALSGALAATLLAGAAYAGSGTNPAKLAQKVQVALTKGQADRAIDLAEPAVASNPRDAGLRALLGQAYLKAGRFQSAAQTFDEAIQLGDTSGRTALGLALAQIGNGRGRDAVAVLDTSRDAISVDDLGLAYALAGETTRGVAVLADALRAGEPTPKLRQNLAYAYALDGRWRDARVMMAQDVPADRIDDRISEWAMQGRPEDYQKRVATLIGAPLRADSGRPANLALVAEAPAEFASAAPVEMPASETAAVQVPAELPPVDTAAAELPATSFVSAEAPTPAPASEIAAPSPSFEAAFATPTFTSQPVIQAIAPGAPESSASARPGRKAAAGTGSHNIQLGSFSSEQGARRAWGIFVSRNPELRNYTMKITPVVVRGRNYWRVAAAGLTAGSAGGVCSAVKARGGACIAYASSRPLPSDASSRYAMAQRARRR